MSFLRFLGVGLCGALWTGSVSATEPPGGQDNVRVRLFADTDDDDRDGQSDRDGTQPADAADVLWFEAPPGKPFSVVSVIGKGVRVIAGQDVVKAKSGPVRRVGLQGLGPGTSVVDFGDRQVTAFVCEVWAEDLHGDRVDLATSHASLSRTLPATLAKHVGDPADADALRWFVMCPEEAPVTNIEVTSYRPGGGKLDTLALPVRGVQCPEESRASACGVTPPLRAAVDAVDRGHPASVDASVRAEVGGTIALSVEGRKAASIRVGGPRTTERGPIDRYRGRLKVHVVRQWPGGAPPVGGDDRGATAAVLREIRAVDSIWGQCGIVFGPLGPEDLRIEDPPGPHLIAVGCEAGLPASGGTITVSVEGTPVSVEAAPRDSPVMVASRLAQAIRDVGYLADVSPNARTATSALRTVDVLVRHPDGNRAEVGPFEGPLSTDATLSVCIGEVDLSDGLDHFGDLDAASGTLEERTLIKALADSDPTTIDVFIIGSFSRTGRIGESFIDADRSSIQNAVIVDRAGIRAGPRSYALPHELGHVLLDMPGHPDDFGVDRPWMLMDADAADPTIFGPRRLPTSDCERALRQSGSDAPMPLLEHWPLVQPVRSSGGSETAGPEGEPHDRSPAR